MKTADAEAREAIGATFGLLKVTEYLGKSKWAHPMLACLCGCGAKKSVSFFHLRSGAIKTCGCEKGSRLKRRFTKHAMTKAVPEYGVWSNMRRRCAPGGHKNYSGRGLKVCAAWQASFLEFLRDMGPRPTQEHSIERLDNSRGYEPGNCVWATRAQQNRNTRRTHLITFNGETLPMKDWAKKLGVNYTTLANRINKHGWSVDRALTTPIESDRKSKKR